MAIIITITALYVLLIGSFCWGFERVTSFVPSSVKAKTRFTIIVPFRNEAQNLPFLLASISCLDYPKAMFEVILVDDDSTDDSRNNIEDFVESQGNIQVISTTRSTTSPKKDAITLAISLATTDWIITTDADCVLPKQWLKCFDAYIQEHDAALIAAPVSYDGVHGFLQNFQLLDVLSLQGATIGGFGIKKPFLCNGANLAYTKHLFNEVNGFEGNSEVASGDDVFLLEKASASTPHQVHYLKSKHAIVTTKALNSISALVNQRVRWAAKSSAYKKLFGKLAGSLVFAQNALVITCLCLTLFGVLSAHLLLYVFLIKTGIDFVHIYKSAAFFNQSKHLKHYALAAFIYPFFSVYVVVIAVFIGYHWKDRSYQK